MDSNRTMIMNLQAQSSQSFDMVSDDGDRENDEEEGAAATTAITAEKQDQNFVRRETRLIMWLKIMVIMVLVVAMVVMSWLAFRSVKKYEVSLFDTRFRDDAMSLVGNFYQEEANRIRTTALGANLYQIHSQFLGVPLHMCNLPGLFGFDDLGFSSSSLAYGENILFAPVIYDQADRQQFESYAAVIGDDDLGNASFHNRSVGQGIFELINGTTPVNSIGSGPFAPVFQIYPSEIKERTLMFDLMSEDVRGHAFRSMISNKKYVMSKTLNPETETQLSTTNGEGGGPTSIFMMPIFDQEGKVGGTSATETDWKRSFSNILQNEKAFIHVVLENTCGEIFTFLVHGMDAKLLGPGDHHDPEFNSFELSSSINGFRKFWAGHQTATPPQGYITPLPPAEEVDESLFHFGDQNSILDLSGCEYRIRLYPTEAFEENYLSNRPVVYTSFINGIFMLSAVLFLFYDCLVERRQTAVMTKAVQSSAIINGLFPKIVQERLFSDHEERSERSNSIKRREADPFRNRMEESSRGRRRLTMGPAKIQLRPIISSGDVMTTTCHDYDEDISQSAPIADLFPNTTVMFADIAGFTAWSSEREPAQVFILLETLYNEFDEIANRNGVFKVETIGDCYVAATGLPEPNHDHAVVLARFAWECLLTMRATCKRLEGTLGPGTGDLALRVGLHSGPTTAGVLRGEKSRFQLFGDTMNTASRMESNGLKNMVQLSEATASILTSRGKSHWLVPREDKIEAKGKGTMQTYWMRPNRRESSATGSIDESPCQRLQSHLSLLMLNSSMGSSLRPSLAPPLLTGRPQKLKTWSTPAIKYEKSLAKEANLVDWNVEVPVSSLRKVVAMRECTKLKFSMLRRSSNGGSPASLASIAREKVFKAPIEELTGIIELPDFNDEFCRIMQHDTADLEGTVRDELHDFVSKIASMYRDNHFHNFEHASHVTMSANKLMNRIVLPEDVDYRQGNTKCKEDEVALLESVHNSTFGISSDPLAQFAIIFSALIHDIDHTGLTNTQLVKEEGDVAILYKGLSVAEQNSVTVAWGLLLRPEYERLCMTIFSTPSERIRFRQLVVNAVLATDIVDAKLTRLRKNRWDKAFHDMAVPKSKSKDRNRKATIVMEHIIQASDVAHSMQHWRIYCKWNEKLFEERYQSFLGGREGEDPSIHWYENEISFFDNYVIPLSNKLRECGVFGVSSDEYLGFAIENRMEWEKKGRDVVHRMLQRMRQQLNTLPGVSCASSPSR